MVKANRGFESLPVRSDSEDRESILPEAKLGWGRGRSEGGPIPTKRGPLRVLKHPSPCPGGEPAKVGGCVRGPIGGGALHVREAHKPINPEG